MWLSGRSAQATKSSKYLRACGAPPLPQTSDGRGVIPTSATGWKYDPSAAPGSSPIASNCAAMYLTARRPPRVAGARPSSSSSARYLRCASIAAVLAANVSGAGVGARAGRISGAAVAQAAAAAATRVTLRIGCDPRDWGSEANPLDPPSARGHLSRMLQTLRSRRVEKLPDQVRLAGRVLLLTVDPGLVRRQLEGEDLAWRPGIALRDDISTDEITPAYICYYYDETLGDFPYLGLKCGEQFPIGRAAVRRGGFVASVSGKRRGKGSSREQSPYAEMCAGIKLVVAENIERIYKENCQNLGVLTTTDFSLLDTVRREIG